MPARFSASAALKLATTVLTGTCLTFRSVGIGELERQGASPNGEDMDLASKASSFDWELEVSSTPSALGIEVFYAIPVPIPRLGCILENTLQSLAESVDGSDMVMDWTTLPRMKE